MSFRSQVIIIIVTILFVTYLISLVKKKKMDFKSGFSWLLLGVCVMILAIFPKLLDVIAVAVGIASPINMLFFCGFCISLCIIFSLSMTVSKLSDQVTKLTQEIAILRKDVYNNYVHKEDK